MIVLELVCIALAGLVLGRPLLDKPFSEDDGKWFHHAVFRSEGVGLWDRGHGTAGYFGIETMAVVLSRLLGGKGPRFFYACKLAWYVLTALALYWLVWELRQDHLAALLSGLAFIAVCCVPQTLFLLTYGEHVCLLPLVLSLLAALWGVQSGSAGWLLASGALCAWAVQIKLTAAVPGLFLAVALAAYGPGTAPVGWFLAGGVVLTLLPGILLPLVHGRPASMYFKPLLAMPGQFLALGDRFVLLRRLRPGEANPEGGAVREGFDDGYVGVNHARTRGERLRQVAVNLRRPLSVLWGLALLAVMGAVSPDAVDLGWLALFVAFLLAQQLQQNYFTPHFNPLWLPVAALAGEALATGGWFAWAVGAAQAVTLAVALRRARAAEARDYIGAERTPIAAMFKVAESVGLWIREHTAPGERLFVWGDHPALYLYARRRHLGPASFFLYGHKGSPRYLDWIIETFRGDPPEYLLFFNYKVRDGWDAEALARRSGTAYDLVRVFRAASVFPGADGDMDFGLYRRNDAAFRHQLVERARRAADRGDGSGAAALLERALELAPGDALARARLDLARGADPDAVASGLLTGGDAGGRAVAFLLTARRRLADGDGAGAVDLARQAATGLPGEPEAQLALAAALEGQGRIKEAFVAYGKVLEANPQSPDALTGLGRLLLAAGNEKEGRTLLARANAVDPLHEAAREAVTALGLKPEPPYTSY